MISIIININKYDKYKILDCINNIKDQTIKNIEIIINCQSEKKEIENLLKEEEIEGVKVFCKFNFEKIIKKIHFDYFINKIFEDRWMPNLLEQKLNKIKNENYDVVCSNFYYCDELSRIKSMPKKIENSKLFLKENLEKNLFYSTLIRKNVIEKIKNKNTFENVFLELLNDLNIKFGLCDNRLYLKNNKIL
jgi:hypothetical protein